MIHRICNGSKETTEHLLASYEALASTKYIHQQMAIVVYWHRCATLLSGTSWHDQQPLPVTENDETKLLCGFLLINILS